MTVISIPPAKLLPSHHCADRVLRLDHVIRILRVVGDRELHALDLAVEMVANRTVVRRNRGARILTHIGAVVGGEDRRQRRVNPPFADLFAVGVEGRPATFASPSASTMAAGGVPVSCTFCKRLLPVELLSM